MTVKTPDAQDGAALTSLVVLMKRLLAPGGCPWDREQSFATLRKYVVEEAHEVVDAIDALGDEAKDPQGPARAMTASERPVVELREELGDLLFQVVFQAELARSRGWFGIDDVVAGVVAKMERRHPHVFGDATVAGTDEVLANWEKLKATEKKGRGTLGGMPSGLPALRYALRLGQKASSVGFDWPDASGPRAKIDEEVGELDRAIEAGEPDAIEHELGDLLFSVVNLARKRGLDPEDALRKANRRFESRFGHVEQRVSASGRTISDASVDELDALWNDAKRA